MTQYCVIGNDGNGNTVVISRPMPHGEALHFYRYLLNEWIPGNVQFWNADEIDDLGLPEWGE